MQPRGPPSSKVLRRRLFTISASFKCKGQELIKEETKWLPQYANLPLSTIFDNVFERLLACFETENTPGAKYKIKQQGMRATAVSTLFTALQDSAHLPGEFRPTEHVPFPSFVDVPGIVPRPCPGERLVEFQPPWLADVAISGFRPRLRGALGGCREYDRENREVRCG